MVKRSVILAGTAVLLGASGTEAFAPYHAPGLVSRVGMAASGATSIDGACAARRSGVQLRMGLDNMFGQAVSNNPNIPVAKATGPGSPGFSLPRQEPTKAEATTTLEQRPCRQGHRSYLLECPFEQDYSAVPLLAHVPPRHVPPKRTLTAVRKKYIHAVVQARVFPANTEAW